LIDVVNSKWIQVRRSSAPEGLFNFDVPDVKRRVLQLNAIRCGNYEVFLDFMFQVFWNLVELSLNEVRSTFESELKPRMNHAFDSLQQDLSEILIGESVPELFAAVTQARTDMNLTLERVKNWFRLSTTTDKPDFDLNTLVNIAIQSTNNCFRHSPIDPEVEIQGETRLTGATLSIFVELLYLFLSNIVLRSGVHTRPARTRLSAAISDEGVMRLSIENEVSFESDAMRREAETRIEAARAVVKRETASTLIGKEGGTGYAKAWKIIKYDLGCPFVVDCGFRDEDKFTVDLWIDAHTIRSTA
jgi:hypothetical protein